MAGALKVQYLPLVRLCSRRLARRAKPAKPIGLPGNGHVSFGEGALLAATAPIKSSVIWLILTKVLGNLLSAKLALLCGRIALELLQLDQWSIWPK